MSAVVVDERIAKIVEHAHLSDAVHPEERPATIGATISGHAVEEAVVGLEKSSRRMATLRVGEGVEDRRRTAAIRREDGAARIHATVLRRPIEEAAGGLNERSNGGGTVGGIGERVELLVGEAPEGRRHRFRRVHRQYAHAQAGARAAPPRKHRRRVRCRGQRDERAPVEGAGAGGPTIDARWGAGDSAAASARRTDRQVEGLGFGRGHRPEKSSKQQYCWKNRSHH